MNFKELTIEVSQNLNDKCNGLRLLDWHYNSGSLWYLSVIKLFCHRFFSVALLLWGRINQICVIIIIIFFLNCIALENNERKILWKSSGNCSRMSRHPANWKNGSENNQCNRVCATYTMHTVCSEWVTFVYTHFTQAIVCVVVLGSVWVSSILKRELLREFVAWTDEPDCVRKVCSCMQCKRNEKGRR